jgi:hypothetical protein
VKVRHVEELILENRLITVRDIASNNGMSVGNVETYVYQHLWFKEACAQGLPDM